MLNIKEKPYLLLFFTAIAIALTLYNPPFTGIDFRDKTMFMVPMAIFVWIIPLLLIILWGLYVLTRRILYSRAFNWTHIVITVLTSILIMLVLYFGIDPSQLNSPGVQRIYSENRQELIGNVAQLVFLVYVGGQFIYFANVLLVFLVKK